MRDLGYFRQVRVDDEARTVVWPNGLDPAPTCSTVVASRQFRSARSISSAPVVGFRQSSEKSSKLIALDAGVAQDAGERPALELAVQRYDDRERCGRRV